MKKEYIEPLVKVLTDYDVELMQAASPGVTGTVNGDVQIGNGGVDEDGSMDPDAKPYHFQSVWDEDEP